MVGRGRARGQPPDRVPHSFELGCRARAAEDPRRGRARSAARDRGTGRTAAPRRQRRRRGGRPGDRRARGGRRAPRRPPSGSAARRTGGRSPGRERRAAGRCSRTTRISPRRSRRTGTSSISRRRTGGSPGRATPGRLPFSSASTATVPGASPPASPTPPISSSNGSRTPSSNGGSSSSRYAAAPPSWRRCSSRRTGRSSALRSTACPARSRCGRPGKSLVRSPGSCARSAPGASTEFRQRLRAMAGRAAEPRLGRPVGDDRLAARRRGAPSPGRPRAPAGPGLGELGPLARARAFDEMPFVENPPGGVVVTANNQPEGNGAGPFLGDDWLDGYRARRIHELLQARDDWDVEGSLRLQLDVTPLPWLEIRERVLAAPVSGAAEEVRDLLAAWDGNLAPGSPAATAYVILACRVVLRALREAAPRSAAWAAGKGFHVLAPSTLYGRRRMAQLPGLVEKLSPAELAGSAGRRRGGPAAARRGSGRLGLGPRTPRRSPASPRPQAAARPGLRHRPAADRRRRVDRGPGARHTDRPAGPTLRDPLAARGDRRRQLGGKPLLPGRRPVGEPALVPLRGSPGALPARRRRSDRLVAEASVRAATVDTLRLVPLRDAPPSEAA